MSKLTPGQMIAGAGGVLLIISLFLNWDDLASQSAFDLFSSVDIILLLIGLAAVGWAGATASGSTGVPANSSMVLCVLGVLAVGFALAIDLEDSTAGIGAWLALISAAAITYGAYAAGQESSTAPAPRAPAAPPPTSSAPPPAS